MYNLNMVAFNLISYSMNCLEIMHKTNLAFNYNFLSFHKFITLRVCWPFFFFEPGELTVEDMRMKYGCMCGGNEWN